MVNAKIMGANDFLHTIKNEFLSVSADEQGAELHSVISGGTELLWQGDPKWWAGRAPILFPFVGKLKNGSYVHGGKQYTWTQNHGFARRGKFTFMGSSRDTITFSFCGNNETRNVYPFEFELLVTYKLAGQSLHCRFKVTNKSDADMYFSIGGHPAFNCPFFRDETLGETEVGTLGETEVETFEDYEIIFDNNETAGTHIITKEGLVSCETAPFFDNSNQISLNHELFHKYQTLVFSNLISQTVTLRSRKTGAGVALDFTGFPYFGIWQPPGAPFICLEPWQGIDDSPVSTGNLAEKAGIMRLAPESEHSCGFTLTPQKLF